MVKIILIVLLISSYLHAQEEKTSECYKVPFASKGNSVELSVENTSLIEINNVRVLAEKLPEWIKMDKKEVIIEKVKQQEELPVIFSFDVDRKAPVGEEAVIKFALLSKNGERGEKEIRISVTAPDRYELYQNYPNPFNPVTTISYQIPISSKVTLKIYNLLGEEIKTLVNEIQEAGYFTPQWNGSNVSSGMYIYQLIAKGTDGNEFIQRKKMMLVK